MAVRQLACRRRAPGAQVTAHFAPIHQLVAGAARRRADRSGARQDAAAPAAAQSRGHRRRRHRSASGDYDHRAAANWSSRCGRTRRRCPRPSAAWWRRSPTAPPALRDRMFAVSSTLVINRKWCGPVLELLDGRYPFAANGDRRAAGRFRAGVRLQRRLRRILQAAPGGAGADDGPGLAVADRRLGCPGGRLGRDAPSVRAGAADSRHVLRRGFADAAGALHGDAVIARCGQPGSFCWRSTART